LIVQGNRHHSRLWGELIGHTADRVSEQRPAVFSSCALCRKLRAIAKRLSLTTLGRRGYSTPTRARAGKAYRL
jgi:hypothetical protein